MGPCIINQLVENQKVFNKLVESYALDAIDYHQEGSPQKPLKSDVTKVLHTAGAATLESRPSVGLGTDCRLESKKINGFARVHDNQILHLSVFTKSNGGREGFHSSRMQRFSNRRRLRS